MCELERIIDKEQIRVLERSETHLIINLSEGCETHLIANLLQDCRSAFLKAVVDLSEVTHYRELSFHVLPDRQ